VSTCMIPTNQQAGVGSRVGSGRRVWSLSELQKAAIGVLLSGPRRGLHEKRRMAGGGFPVQNTAKHSYVPEWAGAESKS